MTREVLALLTVQKPARQVCPHVSSRGCCIRAASQVAMPGAEAQPTARSPTCLSFEQGQEWDAQQFLRCSDHPPGPLQLSRTGCSRTDGKLKSPWRVRPPSLHSWPGPRAIHAARDGNPQGFARPGPASRACDAGGQVSVLARPPTQVAMRRRPVPRLASSKRRRCGAAAYLRGVGSESTRRGRPSAASEGQSAKRTRQ